MKRAIVLGLAAMLFLVSCSDSAGPDDDGAPNDFRFAYTSSFPSSGDFQVHGGIDVAADSLPDSSFVLAAIDSTGELVIVAVQGSTKNRYDVVYLDVADGRQPTTIQLDSACSDQGTCGAAPPIVVFQLDGVLENALSCFVVEGIIALTSVTRDRIRGTLSGSDGKCIKYASNTEGDFRLTNGAFDVALLRVKDFSELPDVGFKLDPSVEPPVIKRHLGSRLRKRE